MAKVVVGLSGGVDSSVTAQLLVDQGHEVIGIFMKNWDDADDEHCPASVDAMDARMVADKIGIPFYTVNFAKEYWDEVFEYFLEQHRLLRTPSPDILCNQYIKFKHFLNHAKALDADFVATGHYARIGKNDKNGLFELQSAVDQSKDQTYFLCTLGQEALSQTLFPLGEYPKSKVRELAEEYGFVTAHKKDSTGICFIGERDYMSFLKEHISQSPGNMETVSGQKVGEHIGLSFYTLGQRKNLHIGGVKGYPEEPWFVLAKNPENNTLIVGQNGDDQLLYSGELVCSKVSWVSGIPFDGPVLTRLRHLQEFQAATVSLSDTGETTVSFADPQRAITPGQQVVFYSLDGLTCLGGGEIR